jgi:hypothetical protein
LFKQVTNRGPRHQAGTQYQNLFHDVSLQTLLLLTDCVDEPAAAIDQFIMVLRRFKTVYHLQDVFP